MIFHLLKAHVIKVQGLCHVDRIQTRSIVSYLLALCGFFLSRENARTTAEKEANDCGKQIARKGTRYKVQTDRGGQCKHG